MSQAQSEQQEAVSDVSTEHQFEELVRTQVIARRAQFAQSFIRYVAWGAAFALVPLFILWLIFQQYYQFSIASASLLVLAVAGQLYPAFSKRGQMNAGIVIFVAMFLVVITTGHLLLPELVVSVAIGYVILILVSNQLLGPQASLWVVPVSILLLIAGVIVNRNVNWFVPLESRVTLIAEPVIGAVSLLVVSIVIRGAIVEQERYFSQSNLANLKLETRATAEQEQREHLQTTVQEYVAYMTKVEQGNLADRLSLEGDGHRPDDPLLILGHQLNQTTNSLQGMIAGIHEAASNLGSAAAEILAAATQQVSGANEQSAAISQTTATVEEVKTISEQSTERAQAVVDTSQHTVEISRAGRQAVEDTIASMAQIKERVESIAENILALSEQTQQIGEIITTVGDIATQSNMLALNASVEAARAGEHGKGFTVVAQEVRNLAEQSQQATAQVRSILLSIQDGINTTVMATEEGIKVVDSGVQLVAQASEAIEQLADVIDESAQMSMQMMAGGRQQASGVEQIAVAMQNINQVTVQGLASTQQAEKAAQDLNDLARSLTEIVEQYRL